ncbi:hypothetical protein BH09BAC5_BH09BAC5_11480 [soil metagenome]
MDANRNEKDKCFTNLNKCRKWFWVPGLFFVFKDEIPKSYFKISFMIFPEVDGIGNPIISAIVLDTSI